MKKFFRQKRWDSPPPCGAGLGEGGKRSLSFFIDRNEFLRGSPLPIPPREGEGTRPVLLQLTVFPLRALIWLYRHSLSGFIGNQCRFMPTCSDYADQALREHGAIRGGGLAIRRFCRCHPIRFLGGGQGFDPVPPHVK